MSSDMREEVVSLRRLAEVIRNYGTCAPAALETVANNIERLLARTEAGADGAVGYVSADGNAVWLTEGSFSLKPAAGTNLFTHPQDASGDAAPVMFGRDSGGDWYVDTDTKSICVDVDFDPARQLSLILKQDGSVAWSIFVQEPDSSTTKATGPSVMNPGFYEALSYIAMQAKEAK